MARSVLQSFVSGARQMLGLQLFISVGAVALAGWTLVVTNDLIRERDRLQDRVIQLEGEMGNRGIVVPARQTTIETAPTAATGEAYPPPTPGENTKPGAETPPSGAQTGEPAAPGAPSGAQGADSASAPQTAGGEQPASAPAAAQPAINPAQIIANLFTPPPPLQTVVLHVRSERDSAYAQRIGRELARGANVRISVDVMAPRDPRESGYAYFDLRQARPSAAVVAQFNDIARRQQIAPWSAQLRGTPLPASGEYGADRLDIVLPPLPARETIR